MKVKNISHTVLFDAKPLQVYRAFLSAEDHAKITGMKAIIEPTAGAWFKTCGNRNFGYNLYLKNGKKIVQGWSHISFPKGHFSVIDLEFEKTEEGKTRMIFNQYGAPYDSFNWLDKGWHKTYWEPMQEFFKGRKS
jgi:hypothetical protein